MFEFTTLLAFLAASLAIILAPGPAQALVLTRSLSDGRRAGILTGLGLNVGALVHALAAALGLSAILALLDSLYEIILASAAGVLSRRLAGSPRFALWRQRVTGVVLVGLGVRLALTPRE